MLNENFLIVEFTIAVPRRMKDGKNGSVKREKKVSGWKIIRLHHEEIVNKHNGILSKLTSTKAFVPKNKYIAIKRRN